MGSDYRELVARHPALGLVGNTPLVRIELPGQTLRPSVQIHAKVELVNPGGSIKDRPVMRMLTEAVLSGELVPGKTILDSSSGNAGIAYAMIGSLLGYPVELVVPANASEERKKRIRAHGARLHLTDPMLGYDEALRQVNRMAHEHPERYFFCDQYRNELNWRAHYETTAEEIWAQTGGRVTHFVAGVGTGGTITGVGRRLRELNPAIQIVCVVPESFPGIEGLKPLEDPDDIIPEIFDAQLVDRRIRVQSEDGYTMCHRLARQGHFAGQSSGAYLTAACQVASELDEGLVVTVLNDTGERYYSARLWD
jgi:S-sulfo-L-cysteine synthase (O-acetyl-L-serine-dependent)